MLAIAGLIQLAISVVFQWIRDQRIEPTQSMGRSAGIGLTLKTIVSTLVSTYSNNARIDQTEQAKGVNRLHPFEPTKTLPLRPKLVVVFVRGTFGKAGYDKRWNSVKKSIEAVEPNSIFRCFHWPGRNSEIERISEGRILAANLQTIAALYSQAKIVVIGHSHGGSVIEHALRFLAPGFQILPVGIGTPAFSIQAKQTDLFNASHTATLYAAAFTSPFLLAMVYGYLARFWGIEILYQVGVELVFPVGFMLILIMFKIKPYVWAARDALLQPLPPISKQLQRISCKGDEILTLLNHAEQVRVATEPVAALVNLRLNTFFSRPWINMITRELLLCGFLYALFLYCANELSASEPTKFPPLFREAGILRDMMIIVSTVMCKLLLFTLRELLGVLKVLAKPRPTLYKSLAELISLALIMMNAGIVHVCRVATSGMRFIEGILVELLVESHKHDGHINFTETCQYQPGIFGYPRIHSASLDEPAVLERLNCLIAAYEHA